MNALTPKNSKVKHFEPYCLRHTALTNLGEAGCDAFTLARIAGRVPHSCGAGVGIFLFLIWFRSVRFTSIPDGWAGDRPYPPSGTHVSCLQWTVRC